MIRNNALNPFAFGHEKPATLKAFLLNVEAKGTCTWVVKQRGEQFIIEKWQMNHLIDYYRQTTQPS